jgi:hypothetical protein
MHLSPNTTNRMNAHHAACSCAFAAKSAGLLAGVVAKATTKIRRAWASGGLRDEKESTI